MMSKWTEVRDGLIASMDVKEITEITIKEN